MDNVLTTDFVNVGVRIRPLLDECPRCLELVNKTSSIIYIPERAQAFTFDTVFDENADQETVYQAMVKPLVDKVKEGYNCTVFAYGQTGTGKTYTMGSNPHTKIEDAGFISRALEDFFFEKNPFVYAESEIFISFYEIYNEKVFDLLGNTKIPCLVKEFKIQSLNRNCVKTPYEATRLLEMGSKNRHVGETKQNRNSSRSHAIFTIYCTTKYENHETVAKLNLVDLAGSENVKRTGNRGSQLHEGININKGLLCIGQVMNALSRNDDFVPYRQSTITTILQDSLNKTNYVTLIACISPNVEDVHETVHTLDFASRAKKLKNKPELNKFKKENPQLFCKSVTKSTPRKTENNLSYPTPSSSAKRRKFTEIETNSLPVIMESCQNSSFLKDLADVSSSTVICPVSSTPALGNKENLQGFPWNRLEETIASVVRSEIQRLKIADFSTARKTLNFNSSPAKHLNEEEPSPLAKRLNENEPFKVPEIPKRFIANPKSSPNDRKSPKKLRRSVRLSLKKVDTSMNTSLSYFDESFNKTVARRRSVRLLNKSSTTKSSPSPKKIKKQGTIKAKSSPKTAHKNYVFDIINNGNQKKLQSLATIGPKTASLIETFRGINGKFNEISDLKKLPFWGEKTYERFCKANLIL